VKPTELIPFIALLVFLGIAFYVMWGRSAPPPPDIEE
jgi:hypothetical protein